MFLSMPTNDPSKPGENQNEDGSLRPDSKMPRQPVQTFLFWLILLFALPFTLFFLKNRSNQDVDELQASDFETLLEHNRVEEAVIIKDPNGQVRIIEGEYRPIKTGAEGQEPEVRDYRVEVVYSDALDKMLRESGAKRRAKSNSNLFGSILLHLLPIVIFVALIYFLFSRQLKAAGRGALQFGKSRARKMSPSQDRVTFEEVSGIDEAKE